MAGLLQTTQSKYLYGVLRVRAVHLDSVEFDAPTFFYSGVSGTSKDMRDGKLDEPGYFSEKPIVLSREQIARLHKEHAIPAAKLAAVSGSSWPRPRVRCRTLVQPQAEPRQPSPHIAQHLFRVRLALEADRHDAWRRMHDSLADQHRWDVSVLRGHCAYCGMPHNWRALAGFRQAVRRISCITLRRRSQRLRRAFTTGGASRTLGPRRRLRNNHFTLGP